MKSFGVRFYAGNFANGAVKVSDVLQSVYEAQQNDAPLPHTNEGNISYELRDLQPMNDGAVFQGVFAVLRDEAPHIREASGQERPIDLEDDERVIEKNHFLFYRRNELLVWQVNTRASHVRRFEAYLSNVSAETISLNDVMSRAAIQRLRDGVVKKFKVRVQRPRNAELINANEWDPATFALMNSLGGSSLALEVSAGRGQSGLSAATKNFIRNFRSREETKSLKVHLLGEQEPIDLFADCIKGKVTVRMNGFYPDSRDMFVELNSEKANKQGELDAYFGVGLAVLD